MEDSELTRRAVEELLKEMDENKEKDSIPIERKKNPLGRPNKNFLGRTINSIMKHNKRQSDRNLLRSERKLKELNAKQKKHGVRRRRKKYVKLETYHEAMSSDCYDEVCTSKKKKKKNKSGRRSCSSSTSSSSNGTDSSIKSENKIRKKARHINTFEHEEAHQNIYNDYNNESTMGYYMDPNMAYVVMAYNQVNYIMQHQRLVQEQTVKNEIEERIEIPSDLSLSCHSSPNSSLDIILHSSSAEEDENGILTFKLSSDDEERVFSISQDLKKKSAESNTEKPLIDCDENNEDSVCSHISLDSKDSKKSLSKETCEIYSLSSSDSEEIEIVEVITGNVSNTTESDRRTNEKSLQGS